MFISLRKMRFKIQKIRKTEFREKTKIQNKKRSEKDKTKFLPDRTARGELILLTYPEDYQYKI